MIRTIWTLVSGLCYTIWYGGGVVVSSMFRSKRLPCVCERAPRIWSERILQSSGTTVEIEGAQNLCRDEPQIIVSNHESWFDVFALAVALPVPFRFVAKEELGRIPIFGAAWQACGHVSIRRDDRKAAIESLEEAGRRIREQGATIILFPEGTRSPDGRLQPFKKGAFVLALQAGVPVVPVAIHGSRDVMPKGSFRITPGRIRIRVGKPISVAGLGHPDRDHLRSKAWDAVARLKETSITSEGSGRVGDR